MLFGVSKFFGSIHLDQIKRPHGSTLTPLLLQLSRTMPVGFLSSRKPRKTGARNFPSRVY
jgi:hypothetical protein